MTKAQVDDVAKTQFPALLNQLSEFDSVQIVCVVADDSVTPPDRYSISAIRNGKAAPEISVQPLRRPGSTVPKTKA